jgi:hypothetical protein
MKARRMMRGRNAIQKNKMLKRLMRLLLVGLPGVVCCVGAEDRTNEGHDRSQDRATWWSPDSRFYLLLDKEEGKIDKALRFRSKDGEEKANVLTIERGCEVRWHPGGEYFCILDHSSGHTTVAYVFGVLKNSEGKFIRLEQLYRSPWPTRADHFWRFVSWDFDTASVWLECRFATEDAKTGKRVWQTRRVHVLLDYK